MMTWMELLFSYHHHHPPTNRRILYFHFSATFLRSSEDLDDFDDCCNLTNHHSWDRGVRPLNTSFRYNNKLSGTKQDNRLQRAKSEFSKLSKARFGTFVKSCIRSGFWCQGIWIKVFVVLVINQHQEGFSPNSNNQPIRVKSRSSSLAYGSLFDTFPAD